MRKMRKTGSDELVDEGSVLSIFKMFAMQLTDLKIRKHFLDTVAASFAFVSADVNSPDILFP
jgi:hypothetical protein